MQFYHLSAASILRCCRYLSTSDSERGRVRPIEGRGDDSSSPQLSFSFSLCSLEKLQHSRLLIQSDHANQQRAQTAPMLARIALEMSRLPSMCLLQNVMSSSIWRDRYQLGSFCINWLIRKEKGLEANERWYYWVFGDNSYLLNNNGQHTSDNEKPKLEYWNIPRLKKVHAQFPIPVLIYGIKSQCRNDPNANAGHMFWPLSPRLLLFIISVKLLFSLSYLRHTLL